MASILVVDDDGYARGTICRALRASGYESTGARNGAQAVFLLQRDRFDLVITDFAMPRLNGVKLVNFVRSLYPKIPVIFISGYLSETASNALLNGAAEVLAKPFELDHLTSIVKRLLEATT